MQNTVKAEHDYGPEWVYLNILREKPTTYTWSFNTIILTKPKSKKKIQKGI